ncbi:MAG: hypothetical protein R3212_09050 [Xanthomonadales bacterium]|nr:hypothetical protein [Xanthomonadales bacterium]
MYANAPYWFAALLVLTLLGFWPSYFSPKASTATVAQHFHAVTMLIWVLMLIVQPWLIRKRRRDVHRVIGRSSLLVALLVVTSALYVVRDNLVGLPQPYPPIGLSFFWLGFASALFYAMLYSLAIINRKDMQLHARYMAATALTFVVPGLGRLMTRLGQATGADWLNFMIALWVPVLIGCVMMVHDLRKGRVRLPWVLATVAWTAIVIGFHLLPRFGWFSAFADWYLAL